MADLPGLVPGDIILATYENDEGGDEPLRAVGFFVASRVDDEGVEWLDLAQCHGHEQQIVLMVRSESLLGITRLDSPA
jgi:hypothetical protein